MCTNNIGLKLNTRKLQDLLKIQDIEALLFGEDQARYIIAVSKDKFSEFEELAKFEDIFCCKIAQNIKDNIIFNDETIKLKELELANNKLFADRFSN